MSVPSASSRLDAFQRAVVESRARTIRVVAPAGSGKTRTIVERTLRRLARGISAGATLLLTFDRAAAATLAERLEREARRRGVDPSGAKVATLNAFGNRTLRERIPEEAGSVIGEAERLTIAGEALDRLEAADRDLRWALPLHVEAGACLSLFTRLKNELVDPGGPDPDRVAGLLLDDPRLAAYLPPDPEADGRGHEAARAWSWLYRAYDRALRDRRGLDFDDQKLRTCLALRRSARLRRHVREGLDEVVVDEFQDVNRLDFELVRAIASDATLVVAGDDDQAIYGFRGCTSRYIVGLERHLGRPVESHELRNNYRNPANLLRAAGRLIRHNRGRIAKRPVATVEGRASIEARRCASPEEEAAALGAWVRSRRGEGARLEEVAVLVRTHAQAAAVAGGLEGRGIPCRTAGTDESHPPGPGGASGRTPGRGLPVATYFKAKGRQWSHVALAGCNDGTIPHELAPVDDERRLFYVGLTRATESVLATYRRERGAPPPSRFLREAGLVRSLFGLLR
ncbi:MAG: ATP-dependent helicase [Gemmatimonadota bacterium]|nr:ATP-dependent helicase [Gemmatimonadota bacterium]